MWNSGSGLKPAVFGPELQVRRHVPRGVEQPVLAQPDDFGRPGRARRGQNNAAGAGTLWRRRPRPRHASVLEAIETVQLNPRNVDAGGGGPIRHHHIDTCACQSDFQATLAAHRQGRVERRDPESGTDGSQEGVGKGHRVADDEADGGAAMGVHPSEEAPPPVHVLLELAEGQRAPVASVLQVGPIAEQYPNGRG